VDAEPAQPASAAQSRSGVIALRQIWLISSPIRERTGKVIRLKRASLDHPAVKISILMIV
jgi:hypothetical protein